MRKWKRNRPKRTVKYYTKRVGNWIGIKKPGKKHGKYLMRMIRFNKDY